MAFGMIPIQSGREYLQAPVDASFELFSVLNTDPAMWAMELLAAIEFSVLPFMMWGASALVAYDAWKNPEM
jgi:hypothetical protein